MPLPATPKELAQLAESFDRFAVAELFKQRQFGKLQGEVQSAHPAVDYSTHIKQFKPTEVLFGWELEIERSPKYHALKKLLDTELGEKQYYVCTDGSLRENGVEIVSLPFPEAVWRQKYSKLHRLLTSLSKGGCKSHDVTTCGLHITASGHALDGHASWQQLQLFINNNSTFFKDISRRENYTYCRFEGGYEKYSALNIGHLDKPLEQKATERAELRLFRGTLLPRSFLASLECFFSLVQWWKLAYGRGALFDYLRFVEGGEYLNLQDYLFENGNMDKPSKRAASNTDAAKKRALAAAKKKEKLAAERERLKEAIKRLLREQMQRTTPLLSSTRNGLASTNQFYFRVAASSDERSRSIDIAVPPRWVAATARITGVEVPSRATLRNAAVEAPPELFREAMMEMEMRVPVLTLHPLAPNAVQLWASINESGLPVRIWIQNDTEYVLMNR